MLIREKIEQKEKLILIPQASFSSETGGRVLKEEEDLVRTAFMVDRDRIIHSKSFRRLKHKTQVYIRISGDHYRTRLTHTLEVSQVAKTIGKGIGLNEDLIEAMALAHDIGHVPFAHSGEEVLNELLDGGFKHNVNSVRVLTFIENDGKGLNLTREVIDGVLNHSGFSNPNATASTLEGQVVKYSDKIAYVNHDIDDSIRAGILKESDLPRNAVRILGNTNGKRIDTLVKDCIYSTMENIEKGICKVSLDRDIFNALGELRDFMFEKVYRGSTLKGEREKAKFVLKKVFDYFYNNPRDMPEFYQKVIRDDGLLRGTADYISGMSDDYCLMLFNNIYVPKNVIY